MVAVCWASGPFDSDEIPSVTVAVIIKVKAVTACLGRHRQRGGISKAIMASMRDGPTSRCGKDEPNSTLRRDQHTVPAKANM